MLRFGIAAVGFALFVLGGAAEAQALAVDCNANPQSGYLASQLAGVAPNTVVQIAGMCLGNVAVATDGLTFESSAGLQPVVETSIFLAGSDGIEGSVEIAGARNVVMNGLSLRDPGNGTAGRTALFWLHGHGSATLQSVEVDADQISGIRVEDGASLRFQSGLARLLDAQAPVAVILVASRGSVTLGLPNSDGTPYGTPIYPSWAAAYAQPFQDCGCTTAVPNPAPQWVNIYNAAVSIRVETGGTLFAYQSSAWDAITVVQGGNLHLEGASAIGTATVSGNSSLWMENASVGGLVLLGGSNATLLGSATGTTQASSGSSITLGGGNVIGPVQIDHNSSLTQRSGTLYGITPLPDGIQDGGMVQMQSDMELGLGLISGQPSLLWEGSVTVQQNSAIHLSGGVNIGGSLTLEQSSNAFADLGNGGTNAVSGGVACVFSKVLASHVSGGNSLTPPLTTQPSAVGTASPQCLGF